MNNQSENVVRPFGRLVATEVALETIMLGEKGHFLSPQSASTATDIPDAADPVPHGG
ncbi:hypothetical protein [Dyella acidiphila]|uniref:Uncharacterized protein n=1 Tax=Dyella acidiphila TaxID=2775866 RepID=A0ABR9G769_9GAMM|nr:hypothetical protein [Dyella acidiphila]MBE1159885.1 hypothetical protein [Dyella acidiphila]